MTLYGIERTYQFGDYQFAVGYDSGSETGLNQRDITVMSRLQDGTWVEDLDTGTIRTFYYEEVTEPHVRNFCRKFGEDAAYRVACLSRTTDWAIRNALFSRNIGPVPTPAMQALGHEQDVWNYLKQHWKAIVALPEYGRIQALDNRFQPSRQIIDPEIRPAVERFNQVPGVKTCLSCQGVTGLAAFQNIPFLVVSPHQRFAYIAFESLPAPVESALVDGLVARPVLQFRRNVLVSTGDNMAFRQATLNLADGLVRAFGPANEPDTLTKEALNDET